MEKEALNFVIEKTNELIAAPSCCKELKACAQKFLDSVETDEFPAAAEKFYAEVEADISPIDHVIALFGSEKAVQFVGEERAKKMKDHAVEIKGKGAKYCDCPACAACEAILSKKEDILGAAE